MDHRNQQFAVYKKPFVPLPLWKGEPEPCEACRLAASRALAPPEQPEYGGEVVFQAMERPRAPQILRGPQVPEHSAMNSSSWLKRLMTC